MNTRWNELLKRRMTRKEFLRTLGVGFIVAANLEGIVKLLTGHSPGTHKPVDDSYSSQGYSGFTGKPPVEGGGSFDS